MTLSRLADTEKLKPVCQYGDMSGTHKLTSVLAAFAMTAAVLSGCTPGTAAQTEPTPTDPAATADSKPATETTTSEASEPSCSGMSQVYGYEEGLYQEREGTLQDLGARDYARGEVTVDEDGTPVTYTVEPGDVEAVIAERLCAYPTLGSMNHVRTIQPGQVLWLTPDPESPWVPYYSPSDAEEGFQQIPYQQAIESAGAAVDAGDVDRVRTIWNDTLKGMFTDQGTISAVQQVVDSGDLDGLRQLFS